MDDADRFHGRSRESWDLAYSGILSRRLVVVTGPAGVGKTSLLQAGVLAMIRPDVAHVMPVVRLDRAHEAPRSVANLLTNAVLSRWSADRPLPASASLSDCLRDVPTNRPPRIIAVLDSFDAVFTDEDGADLRREQFLEELGMAMEDVPYLHLVITIRSDAVDRLAPFEARFSGGDGWRYLLAPLSPGAAFEAVTHPLRGTRRTFAPGVGELLVDKLRTTTFVDKDGVQRTVVAPTVETTTLQIVGAELWNALPDAATTVDAQQLRDVGDVDTLLTAHCLRAVIDVAVTTGQPMLTLWEWLESVFVTDRGTRGSAYEGVSETAGLPAEVARAFERNHVLRSERRAGAIWYELLDDLFVQAVRRGRGFAEDLAEVTRTSTSRASTNAFLVMAESAADTGRLADAEQYARGAVRANRTDVHQLAAAHAFLGALVLEQGRRAGGDGAERFYAIALESLQKAAELYETAQDKVGAGRALALLGQLHLERGERSQALAKLRLALDRVEGGDLGVRIDFARALRSAGQRQAALGEYTRVLHDDSRTVEALVGRGTLSAERGYAAAALRDLDAAVRIAPDVAGRDEVIRARRQAVAQLDRKR